MKAATITIYLPPSGERKVDGYLSDCKRVGVVRLPCLTAIESHRTTRWFGFDQITGCRLTDGEASGQLAMTQSKEKLALIARVNPKMGLRYRRNDKGKLKLEVVELRVIP